MNIIQINEKGVFRMVNILKHGKFNKNPFVKHLKEFSEYPEEMIEEIKRVSDHGMLERNLDKERKFIISQGSIFLVNSKFSSIGFFKIPIEDFNYNSWNAYFIVDPDESDLEYDIGIFFSSKKELYEVINSFDSLKDEHDLKRLMLLFHGLGALEPNRIRNN